jgi:hypothetical protein
VIWIETLAIVAVRVLARWYGARKRDSTMKIVSVRIRRPFPFGGSTFEFLPIDVRAPNPDVDDVRKSGADPTAAPAVGREGFLTPIPTQATGA